MPKDPSALGEAARGSQHIETTVDGPDGETYEMVVGDPRPAHIKQLEQREESGKISGLEAFEELIDEYLVEPDLDSGELNFAWKKTLASGILKAFDAGDSFIDDAMAEVETEGNPE